MRATWEDLNRTFVVTNTGHDSGDWICRVIDWQGELYIRHEVGEYAGNITPANTFAFEDCMWRDPENPVYPLSRAVAITREAKDLDLQFEDLTDQYWGWYNEAYITYSSDRVDIEEDTGEGYGVEVRYKKDEDPNYIRFYVDNGCGDKYDAVFDKRKRVEVE